MDDDVRSYTESRKWVERARRVLVGGGQPHKRAREPEPIMIARAAGSRFWDADGNEYIDYLMGFGPILLGHAHPAVTDAVARHVRERGNVYNVGHTLEVELAEKLVERIPSAERVAYFVGGSDATTGAVKLARAYTGREKVVRCGYHGWHDWCHAERGALLATAAYTLTMPYNDLEALASLLDRHRGGVACVIMEPAGKELPEPGYLEGVQTLCREHDVLLVFDEVKTGFRYALGGAQEYFGVVPDLSVFSKAMGNGFGIAAVVGKEAIMEAVANVWIAATFHGEVSLVAAALATIAEMERRDGIAHLWRQGNALLDGYRELVRRFGIEEHAEVSGVGPMPFFGLRGGDERWDRAVDTFYRETLDGGLYLPRGHVWFVSLSHSDEDIARTLEVSETALERALARV